MPNRFSSETSDASPLGQPLRFSFANRDAPNRFLKAAMTERLSSWDAKDFSKRGIPSDNLINVYRRWGEGGYGVILTGNIMVAYDHLEAPGNPIIPPEASFSDASEPRFKAFAEMASVSKKHGSLVVGQVSHPGRQVESRIQPHPISASDVQLEGEVMGMRFAKPRAATVEDIRSIVSQFTHAAEYLFQAGYDGIQLHGAHGYLLAQFLAATTNKRTDAYGGSSLQSRAKLIVEIARSIRSRVPASSGFLLGIKINSVEFQEGGFAPAEARQLCTLLEENGFDFVELSGGTYESLAFAHKRESTKKREAFFLEFADEIAPGLSRTRTYVTGGLRSVGGMVKALDVVDGVGLARPACQEFDLPHVLLRGQASGAIEQAIDTDDFGLTNVAAGTQIRQVGRDQLPIDLSRAENVQTFQKDMGVWGKKMQDDAADMNLYGYVDLESFTPEPYAAHA